MLRFDGNEDGTITLKEMKKFIRDINGLFNPGELESISEDQLADEAFREMDADGNGLITEEEFIKAAMKDNKVCKMLTLKVVNLISPWSISQIKDSEIFGFKDMFDIWAFTLLERRSLLITYVKIKEKMAIHSYANMNSLIFLFWFHTTSLLNAIFKPKILNDNWLDIRVSTKYQKLEIGVTSRIFR